MGESKFF